MERVWFAKKSLNGEQTVKIKKAKCSALTFSPCIVYLLITCLVQVQKEVSHFQRSGSGPGARAEVRSQCDPLVFSLPVLRAICSGAVSTRRCYSCSSASKNEADWLIDWANRGPTSNTAPSKTTDSGNIRFIYWLENVSEQFPQKLAFFLLSLNIAYKV